eukprot:Phypoly_transcript_11695.p1 GENE.Phypoly_transcript_11695~~Phypoly_transcript_11695.p1  ORF type:complete len:313 (+),score=32.57 Phypoly_transcript_11695:102-1040(+)
MRLWKVLLIFTIFITFTFFILNPKEREPQNKRELVFIFGLGGSGTRAVTTLFHSWGCTNVSKINFALDNIFFHNELDDYIYEILAVTHTGNYNFTKDIRNPHLAAKINETMKKAQVIVGNAQEKFSCVVVKAPRLIFLLPVIHKYFPNAKYVQVVRDGRDMAFSDNIGQIIDFGRYMLTRVERGALSVPLQQVRFWFLVNLQAKHWLHKNISPKEFYLLNIESLVLHDDETTYRLLWELIFESRAPPNLSNNSIFKEPIGAENYTVSQYGKYKHLTDVEDNRRLSHIEQMFRTELNEFGYQVEMYTPQKTIA